MWRTENIGARRLHTLMERLLEDVLFDAPDGCPAGLTVDAAYVAEQTQGDQGRRGFESVHSITMN